jgi:hypothetical protein
MKTESTVQKALNDAEAIIRAARPVFKKGMAAGGVRSCGKYLGYAADDKERTALLWKDQQTVDLNSFLTQGQTAALRDFADTIYPGLTRAEIKARETILQRARNIRVDELEAIQEWNRKRLNRMNDEQRKACLHIRKQVAELRA